MDKERVVCWVVIFGIMFLMLFSPVIYDIYIKDVVPGFNWLIVLIVVVAVFSFFMLWFKKGESQEGFGL